MTTTEFALAASISGNIDSTDYAILLGAGNCDIDYDTGDTSEKRAFFFFNTATLPDDAIITLIEFYTVYRSAQPSFPPDGIVVYVGDMGSSIDASDWNAGELAWSGAALPSLTWEPMLVSSCCAVNKTGYTCVRIQGAFSGLNNAGTFYNDPITTKQSCKLRITWYQVKTEIYNATLNQCNIMA